MQAGAQVGDRFKERQVARLERTVGVSVAWIVHVYLYAAHALWDTDTNSRLRRLPSGGASQHISPKILPLSGESRFGVRQCETVDSAQEHRPRLQAV